MRNHFAEFPLLGAKATSYNNWIKNFDKDLNLSN